jgi:hypothetical protein
MSVEQATAALQEVARTQNRASILRGYEHGAPHFLLWGFIWLVGYAGTDLFPAYAGTLWLVLDLLGVGGGFLIVRAAAAATAATSAAAYASVYGATKRQVGWRYGAVGVSFLAFMIATYYVMGAHTSAQFGAFPALLMGLLYTLAGIWRGVRWAVVGITVFSLTVVGYVLLGTHFLLWMSVCGGGTLLLTGLWMRRA